MLNTVSFIYCIYCANLDRGECSKKHKINPIPNREGMQGCEDYEVDEYSKSLGIKIKNPKGERRE